jgi:hypothetical protein
MTCSWSRASRRSASPIVCSRRPAAVSSRMARRGSTSAVLTSRTARTKCSCAFSVASMRASSARSRGCGRADSRSRWASVCEVTASGACGGGEEAGASVVVVVLVAEGGAGARGRRARTDQLGLERSGTRSSEAPLWNPEPEPDRGAVGLYRVLCLTRDSRRWLCIIPRARRPTTDGISSKESSPKGNPRQMEETGRANVGGQTMVLARPNAHDGRGGAMTALNAV